MLNENKTLIHYVLHYESLNYLFTHWYKKVPAKPENDTFFLFILLSLVENVMEIYKILIEVKFSN